MSGYPCLDCGIDTSSKTGIGEYYHVHEPVWFEAFGRTYDPAKWDPETTMAGFLCIECLEARLGRSLTKSDFSDAPVNDPTLYRKSDRFLNRVSEAVSP